MRNLRTLPLVLALVGCNGGSAGPAIGSLDEAADETVKQMKEIASIVDAVKDKATAEAAKGKLEKVAKRLEQIAAAVEKIGPAGDGSTTGEKIDATGRSLSPTLEAYFARMAGSPEIGRVLSEPFGAVSSQLMRLRGMLGG
jgi:hypothetical protein